MPILRLRGKFKQAPTRQTMHFLSKSLLAFHSLPPPCPEELLRIRRDLKPCVYNSSAAWMIGRIRKLAALSTMMNRESHKTDTDSVCWGVGVGGARGAPRPFNLKGDILSHRWAAGLKIWAHVTCDRGLRSQTLLLCSGHRAMGKGQEVHFLGQVNCFKFVIVRLEGGKGPIESVFPQLTKQVEKHAAST